MDTRTYKNACNSTKQYSQGAPVCSTEIIIILIFSNGGDWIDHHHFHSFVLSPKLKKPIPFIHMTNSDKYCDSSVIKLVINTLVGKEMMMSHSHLSGGPKCCLCGS